MPPRGARPPWNEIPADTTFSTPDWTEATHGRDAYPDFDEEFADSEVKRLDIVITKERWESMLADMASLYGPFGSGGGGLIDAEDPIFVPAEVFYEGMQW